MSSLITQDLSPSLLTAVPDQDYNAPAWSPVQPATETQPGLSDEQRALDQSVAEEAGLGPDEAATLGAFGLRPAELDPAAAARMAVGLQRLQALIACDAGDAAGCDQTGPGLVGHETWQGVSGDRAEDLIVEDGEFTLRLSTRTTPDGQTERTLFYEDIDGTFLSGLSTDPLEIGPQPREVEAAPDSPAAAEEGFASFLEGALLGDFAGNDTWSAVAGQAAIGFIPVVGQIADARDTLAAVRDVAEGKDGAWMKLGAAAVGWIPGVGDALKGGARVGRRVTAEVAEEVAERTLKEGVQQGEKHAAREGFEAVEERASRAEAERLEGAAEGASRRVERPGDGLSEAGRARPVPLSPQELARVNAWASARRGYLDRWLSFDASAFRANTQKMLQRSENAILDHLTPDDLAAALKERRGVQIPTPDGGVFDHGREVANATRSIQNAIKALKSHCEWLRWRTDLAPGEIEAVKAQLEDLQSLLDALRQV